MTIEDLKEKLRAHAGEFVMLNTWIRHKKLKDADNWPCCPLLVALDVTGINPLVEEYAKHAGMSREDATRVTVTSDYSAGEPKYGQAIKIFDPDLRKWMVRELVGFESAFADD